jgi:predicted RNase H-like HicB family nuclease
METSKTLERKYNSTTGGGTVMVSVPVYQVIIQPTKDVGGYCASCDMENGGCTVQGDTLRETQILMFESVAIYLEDYPDIKDYCLNFEYRDA